MFNFRNWRIFARKAESVQLNRFEDEIVNLIAKKKELEYDQEHLQAKISSMELKHKTQLESERQNFELEKKRLEEELNRVNREKSFEIELQKKEILAQKNLEIQKRDNETAAKIQKIEAD